jgi:hypothetical protein
LSYSKSTEKSERLDKDFLDADSIYDLSVVNRKSLRNLTLLVIVSLTVACATYVVDFWLFSSICPGGSAKDASFLEGIISIPSGFLLLLGSGGISQRTERAAHIAATTDSVSGEAVGPSEVFRRDAWKPEGFVRAGLVMMIAGLFLLFIYFLVP